MNTLYAILCKLLNASGNLKCTLLYIAAFHSIWIANEVRQTSNNENSTKYSGCIKERQCNVGIHTLASCSNSFRSFARHKLMEHTEIEECNSYRIYMHNRNVRKTFIKKCVRSLRDALKKIGEAAWSCDCTCELNGIH